VSSSSEEGDAISSLAGVKVEEGALVPVGVSDGVYSGTEVATEGTNCCGGGSGAEVTIEGAGC
jgi:hypothetical protein